MDLKILGKNIRKVRQQTGLTQENAANDLDINNLSQEIKSIKDDIEIIKNILSHR